MSDYSPPPSPNAFDELEDVLYDADPTPDLADELASHALHSPLQYAADFEPGYELQEYYSDWEYYSDDYYDDDPSILKTNPIDGSSSKRPRQSAGQVGSARGRKRKIADRDSDVPPLDDDRRYLRDCMKGTVWAHPEPQRDNVYHAGQNAKVALMKDWKAKFGTASPTKNQGKSKTRAPPSKDEAWANNLSLADMGLMNARGSMAQNQEGDEGEGEEIIDDAEGEDDMESYELDMADEEEIGDAVVSEPESSLPLPSNPPRESSPLAVRSRQTSPESTANGPDGKPNKRRKKNAPAPVLPSPPATNGSTAARRTRSRADSASTTASATTSGTGKQHKPAPAATPAPTANPTSRKRKVSVTDDGSDEAIKAGGSRATGPTTSNRAKRAASTVNNVVSNKSKTVETRAPARVTRSRKK